MAKLFCTTDVSLELRDNLKNMSKETEMQMDGSCNSSKIREDKHYIFMLVGKTGSGRSATGNYILGENYFVSSDTGSTTTSKTFTKTTLRNQIKVTVIDTPGIMDNSVSSDGAKTKACTDLTTAMTECPKDGKLIIVLVLKYGERFTEENRQTTYILENIFGDTNMWKSCIIIMTHGDVSNTNNEVDITFEGWTENQKDDLGKMFKDCSYRCLLCNNRTKNQKERKLQFEKLIMFSDQVDQGYTMTTFVEAKRHRNRLTIDGKLNEIKKTFDSTIKEMIFWAFTISERDDTYFAFKNCVDQVKKTLDIQDSHDMIYYAEGELRLFNDQRVNLNNLDEGVEIRVTLNYLENEAHASENIDRLSIIEHLDSLENSIKCLETKIDSKDTFRNYKKKIVSLQEKLKRKRLDIKRQETRECYEKKISLLSNRINKCTDSGDLKNLLDCFEEADRLQIELSTLEKELGDLQCFPKIKAFKHKIQAEIHEGSRLFTIQNICIILLAIFWVIAIILAMLLACTSTNKCSKLITFFFADQNATYIDFCSICSFFSPKPCH